MKSALKYLLLCLLIFFSFFFGAASNPLFDTSEGTFAQGSMTMAQGGDFLTPYMDGRPDFDNPPLIYWLQTASVNLFGAGELAFRLPSVLAACGWVLLILFFVKDTRNEEMAFNSAFIACSSVIVSVFAKLAVADILLNMFLAGSMFAVYRHFETGRKKYVYLAFAAAGLGAVTKGPVAALVPFAVSALFFLSAGRMKEWVRAVFSPVGIGIMLLVALPWYVVEYMEYGDAFINGFLAKNNPGRFSGAAEGQGGGFAVLHSASACRSSARNIASVQCSEKAAPALERFFLQIHDDLVLFRIHIFRPQRNQAPPPYPQRDDPAFHPLRLCF
ncbi:MAG: glycosyltransferase family 39 protein [Geovibrio sp.]|nr:glycosyltransferase family 39 protein [Geovibrio sp.]